MSATNPTINLREGVVMVLVEKGKQPISIIRDTANRGHWNRDKLPTGTHVRYVGKEWKPCK